MAGATAIDTAVTTVAVVRGQGALKGVALKEADGKVVVEVKVNFDLDDVDPEALFELMRAGNAEIVMSSKQLGLPLEITSARRSRKLAGAGADS